MLLLICIQTNSLIPIIKIQYRQFITLVMELAIIIKIALMVTFFLEVVIFGRCISSLACFKQGRIMAIAMTFSGTLFLSIAMLDIIPQAISNFDIYFSENEQSLSQPSSYHQNEYLPLTMIIAMFTFMLIMYIDKILIGHSHDHQYEVSFIMEPRRSSRDIKPQQMKEMQKQQVNQQKADQVGSVPQAIKDNSQYLDHNHTNLDEKKNTDEKNNYRPFILQAGMSIHAFFQCLAVGLQKTPIGILSLASAILVHKWAEGLTLGLIYKKQGYSDKTSTLMVVLQGCINVLGLITGSVLMGQGNFVMAFFMSISAGTFLYISLAQVLLEQVRAMTKRKLLTMILANIFLAVLVWFQKFAQSQSQKQEG